MKKFLVVLIAIVTAIILVGTSIYMVRRVDHWVAYEWKKGDVTWKKHLALYDRSWQGEAVTQVCSVLGLEPSARPTYADESTVLSDQVPFAGLEQVRKL